MGVSQCTESVHVGILTHNGFTRSGPPRSVIDLHLGNIDRDVPVGVNLAKILTFLNQFVKANGSYPATNFRRPGWMRVFKQQSWSSLTMYVVVVFDTDLRRMGLHGVVRAAYFGINSSIPNFYTILELYCSTSCTFFTPVSELGRVFYEMWEVFNLPMGSMPYEEYFLCVEELAQLEKDKLSTYETYRELIYPFYVYLNLYPSRRNVNV